MTPPGSPENIYDQLIESNGEGVMKGFNLYLAREDFCGALVDPSVDDEGVFGYYGEFTDSLRVALFDNDSSVYIGDRIEAPKLAEVLVGQIACISVLKQEGIALEQVAEIIDECSNDFGYEVDWEKITISALDRIVKPFIEDRQSILTG